MEYNYLFMFHYYPLHFGYVIQLFVICLAFIVCKWKSVFVSLISSNVVSIFFWDEHSFALTINNQIFHYILT